MVNDIARAYFEAPNSRTVAVEFPDEDKSDGQDMVDLLHKSLYGTRDAAINFQREIQRFMRCQGFIVGRYNCSTFHHPVKKLRVMVHGDDLQEVKSKVIGSGDDKETECRVLNRIIR